MAKKISEVELLSNIAVRLSERLAGPRMLNVKEAAAYLGVTVFFMRTLAWEKRVAKIRLGKRDLFDVQDLDAFVEAQKKSAA